jgi:hypothetical protein
LSARGGSLFPHPKFSTQFVLLVDPGPRVIDWVALVCVGEIFCGD